jgi:hypothetical protein
MKRRKFIAATSIVLLGLPVAYYLKKRNSNGDPVSTPAFLYDIFDEQTIRFIGINYRKLVPEENEKKKLSKLILADDNNKKLLATKDSGLKELLEKKVQKEFINNKTIIVYGWEISITEARQCAIFSLS